MKLAKELGALESMTSKLQMYLCGLRVPESMEGALEYAIDEVEEVAGRVSFLAMLAKDGGIPDAEFAAPRETR